MRTKKFWVIFLWSVWLLLWVFVATVCTVGTSPAQAGEITVLKGESAITFTPVLGKAGQLVEIELVSSAKYPSRYKRLELAVFRNDWRPLGFGFANSGQPSPGKCIVTVLSDSYAMDCRMVYPNRKPDILKIKVPDPDMVVGMVTHFSRKLVE